MPNRWAVTSGNWSNTATWNNGGVLGLPTASDDVFSSGSIITINQDIQVNSLSVVGLASTASAGGTFITSGSRTIETFASGTYGGFLTSVLAAAGGSPALIVTGSDTVNIKARQITGAPTAGGIAITGSIWIKNSGITNISSSISIRGVTYHALNISTVSGGTVNIESPQIYGDTLGGGGAPRQAIAVSIACTINITGSILSGTNTQSQGLISTATGLILNVLGSIYNNGAQSNALTINSGTSTINITGSIYSIPSATISTIVIAGTSTDINISGSITADGASAITHTAAGNSTLIGPIASSELAPAVQFTNTSHILNVTGPFYNINGRNAVFAQNLQLISGSTPTWIFDTETYGEQRTLYSTNYPGNFPAPNNVRQGVTFGDTGQFSGTIAMPNTSDVFKGVPINNTTGSASFDTQSVWSVATSSLTASNSVGARLSNTATVATDANLITSKGTI
jgi:hypothetical protein